MGASGYGNDDRARTFLWGKEECFFFLMLRSDKAAALAALLFARSCFLLSAARRANESGR